jgi:hypothetical protein
MSLEFPVSSFEAMLGRTISHYRVLEKLGCLLLTASTWPSRLRRRTATSGCLRVFDRRFGERFSLCAVADAGADILRAQPALGVRRLTPLSHNREPFPEASRRYENK